MQTPSKVIGFIGKDFRTDNLSGASDFRGYDLTRANFAGLNIPGTRFREACLTKACFTETNLSFSNFVGACLAQANLEKANLEEANLSRANLTRAKLSKANLTDANLISGYLTDADLSGANLAVADLRYNDLTRANLTNANLSGAKLIGANLTAANLTGSNLDGADLSGANLRNVIGIGTRDEEVQFAKELMNAINTQEGSISLKPYHFYHKEYLRGHGLTSGWIFPSEHELAVFSRNCPTLAKYLNSNDEEALAIIREVASGKLSVFDATFHY